MEKREIDNSGLACPQPVINTKKAIEEMVAGVLVVIVDNSVAKENVSRFVQNLNLPLTVEEKNGKFYLAITKGEGIELPSKVMNEEITCAIPTLEGNIYFIATDVLGYGSPELGAGLMKSFILTLPDLSSNTKALIFMNGGVKLLCKGSKVIDTLQKMEKNGTKILACGTCLDYFNLKEDLALGQVSNMFEILEAFNEGKVINIR